MASDVSMSLLDDIWAEPLAEEPIPASERRKKAPLFLPGDSDEETSGFQDLPPATETTEIEETLHPDKGKLDAIFADIDDGNEDIFANVDKAIDLEDMQNRAKAKIAATQPSTAMAVDDPQPTSKKDGSSQRRPVAKLDEERLLGPDGFPSLLKDYKAFKVSGKGREAQDLERLFRIYHGWTHRLFPKYRFQDTVERVEKLCRSRRMAVNLRVWRDEAHGLTRSQPEDDTESGSEPEVNPLNTNETRSPQSGAQSQVSSSRPESPINSTRSMSAAPSVPSSVVTDMDDIDAMIREEEELMRELNKGSTASKPYQANEVATVDEEEALWAAAEGAPAVPQMELQTQLPESLEDDADFWDMVDDIQNSANDRNELAVQPKSPSDSVPTNQDGLPTVGGEWEDMYE